MIFSFDDIHRLASADFGKTALKVFDYQYRHVPVYRQYCDLRKCRPENVDSYLQIPFLPIGFYKTHTVLSNEKQTQKIFESSGTTGQVKSKHYVADLYLYESTSRSGFETVYGNLANYEILGLLPSYLERNNSSLVYMVNHFIKSNRQKSTGFYLDNFDPLYHHLHQLQAQKKPVILVSVTFALLQFCEKYQLNFPELIVMETGGMKGRRKEIIREEVHAALCKGFGVSTIHSEYGMTELLSQAYSTGNGIYRNPPWMKIVTRDVFEPTRIQVEPATGAVNVIDLANIFSCSFIATDDLGKVYKDGSFEILGRMDSAEIRGCNLMQW